VSQRAVVGAWVLGLGLLVLGPTVAEAGKSHTQYSGVVNLNEGSQEELDRLPGVGGKAAERVLAYRQKQPFKRIEELVRVKGFGKKKFEKLKPFLAVNGPTTLKEEKASGSDAPRKKKSRH
jgi:competence protein ComEA